MMPIRLEEAFLLITLGKLDSSHRCRAWSAWSVQLNIDAVQAGK